MKRVVRRTVSYYCTCAIPTGPAPAAKQGASMESIKALRQRTQAGMMDCKNALVASNGDLEKAVMWLEDRVKEIAKKKKMNVTPEGLITISIMKDKNYYSAAITELNSETDFIPRLESFQTTAYDATCAISSIKMHEFKSAGEIKSEQITKNTIMYTIPESVSNSILDQSQQQQQMTLENRIIKLIGQVGENIKLRKSLKFETNNNKGVLAGYVHDRIENKTQTPDLLSGHSGVIVALESETDIQNPDKIRKIGEEIGRVIVLNHHPQISELKQKKLESSEGQEQETVAAVMKREGLVDVQYRYLIAGEGIQKKVSDFAKEVLDKVEKSQKKKE